MSQLTSSSPNPAKHIRPSLIRSLKLLPDCHEESVNFQGYLAKQLQAIKQEGEGEPLRRVLDCIREAQLNAKPGERIVTENLAKPLVTVFGVKGIAVAAYLSSLPGFTERTPGPEGFYSNGAKGFRGLFQLRNPSTANCYTDPSWRIASALIFEDALRRVIFDRNLGTHHMFTAGERCTITAKLYKAAADSRGLIEHPGVTGIFDRLLRDSCAALKDGDLYWLHGITKCEDCFVLAGKHRGKAFEDLALQMLRSPRHLDAVCSLLINHVIPVTRKTAGIVFKIASKCTKETRMARRAVGSWTLDRTTSSEELSKTAADIIGIANCSIDQLEAISTQDPLRERIRQILVYHFRESINHVDESLVPPNDDDGRWNGDLTSAP